MSAKNVTSSATEQPQLINGYAESTLLNLSTHISIGMMSSRRMKSADMYEKELAQIAQIFGE